MLAQMKIHNKKLILVEQPETKNDSDETLELLRSAYNWLSTSPEQWNNIHFRKGLNLFLQELKKHLLNEN